MTATMGRMLSPLVAWMLATTVMTTSSCNRDREPSPREADSAFLISGYDKNYVELASLLNDFARDHQMRLVDETIRHPEKGDLVNIEIGDPNAVSIWLATGIIDPELTVLVFADRSKPNSWRLYEVDLKQRLSKRFGGLKDITIKSKMPRLD